MIKWFQHRRYVLKAASVQKLGLTASDNYLLTPNDCHLARSKSKMNLLRPGRAYEKRKRHLQHIALCVLKQVTALSKRSMLGEEHKGAFNKRLSGQHTRVHPGPEHSAYSILLMYIYYYLFIFVYTSKRVGIDNPTTWDILCVSFLWQGHLQMHCSYKSVIHAVG